MVHVAASDSFPAASLCAYLSQPEGGVIRILGGGVPHGLPPSAAAALVEAPEVLRQWRSARNADGADVLRVRKLCPESASAGGGGGGGASSGYAAIMINEA